MFGKKKWESAEATIVLVNIKRVSSDGLTPTRQWAADVKKTDGAVFRAQIDEPRWVTDFWPPDAGAVVKVEVSPHQRRSIRREERPPAQRQGSRQDARRGVQTIARGLAHRIRRRFAAQRRRHEGYRLFRIQT